MPRPGPRPYECVRRAWHSDRHQPIRGSIVQQIFRLVNETHSPLTKKNREWQEKLPVVVLRAEEIMYSKANSEAEYVNLETLWDRVNDAVDTIIRRDESTETGDLLPPCVEERASRSQRHNHPRSYLSPSSGAPESAIPPPPPRAWEKTPNERRPQSSSLHMTNQSKIARGTALSSAIVVAEPSSHLPENSKTAASCSYPSSLDKFSPGQNRLMTIETSSPSLSLGSVYPLYYGIHCQNEDSLLGPRKTKAANSKNIFLGTPINTSISKPSKIGVMQKIFSFNGAEKPEVASKVNEDVSSNSYNPSAKKCDLSLRLGLFSEPYKNMEKEEVESGSSQLRGKCGDPSSELEKGFCFFPGSRVSMQPGCQGANEEATARKRKAPFSSNVEDGRFCWQPEFAHNQFTGLMKRPGS